MGDMGSDMALSNARRRCVHGPIRDNDIHQTTARNDARYIKERVVLDLAILMVVHSPETRVHPVFTVTSTLQIYKTQPTLQWEYSGLEAETHY